MSCVSGGTVVGYGEDFGEGVWIVHVSHDADFEFAVGGVLSDKEF